MSATNGIIIVAAGGNTGSWPGSGRPLLFAGSTFPPRYSRPDNELIVVGGTGLSGALWPSSTQRGLCRVQMPDGAAIVIQDRNDPRLGPGDLVGNIDIYALALWVDARIVGDRVKKVTGTSYAAPQIVSLNPLTWLDLVMKLTFFT